MLFLINRTYGKLGTLLLTGSYQLEIHTCRQKIHRCWVQAWQHACCCRAWLILKICAPWLPDYHTCNCKRSVSTTVMTAVSKCINETPYGGSMKAKLSRVLLLLLALPLLPPPRTLAILALGTCSLENLQSRVWFSSDWCMIGGTA